MKAGTGKHKIPALEVAGGVSNPEQATPKCDWAAFDFLTFLNLIFFYILSNPEQAIPKFELGGILCFKIF